MSDVTREYIAGILCAMQIVGDDEASAAIEKFIVQLEDELAKHKGEWEKEEYRCPQCGLGNPRVAQLEADIAELKRENEALKTDLKDERERLLLEMYNNDTISQAQFDHAIKKLSRTHTRGARG